MNSYVCVSLAPDARCLEWAQTWSVAALSVQDASKLAAAIVGAWALAFGLKHLFRYILNMR